MRTCAYSTASLKHTCVLNGRRRAIYLKTLVSHASFDLSIYGLYSAFSSYLPLVRDSMSDGELQFASFILQVNARSRTDTGLKIERESMSVGGLLTTRTRHPDFEGLVPNAASKFDGRRCHLAFFWHVREVGNTREPMVWKPGTVPSKEKGVQGLQSPIRDVGGQKSMVWSVTFDYSIAWPLEVVDLLQQNGAGLFMEAEYKTKQHNKLHLVLIRFEAEKKGMIYAIMLHAIMRRWGGSPGRT
jgi:hypothetical protein